MSTVATGLPDRYRNATHIASGGMGDILRADDATLGRPVAVKVLADRYAQDEAVRARFTREALAAARLSGTPGIVTIFDVGETADGRPFIVMEHLAGGSLADRIAAEGAQPPERALAWLEETAAALDAAHESGVVHRDVKPANLLLDDAGHVHVADFGIASAAGMHSVTEAGTVLGTAGYLAPEQARGETAGAAADRYALGVVAYELLTGARPFERESPTAEAAAHATAEPPPASTVNGTLPAALDSVFERALAKEPDERYASARQLVAALRAGLDGEPAPTRPLDVPPAVVHRRRRSAFPLAAVLLAAGALAAAGLAAVALTRDGEPATERRPPQETVVRTVTQGGETVRETVTEEAPPPEEEAPPPEQTPPPETGGDPVALNDQGYALMQEGRYEEALPYLEQAVAGLRGSGSIGEAYASYNLAYTRLQLGQCEGVIGLLNRSEQVQGHREEIDAARAQAREQC